MNAFFKIFVWLLTLSIVSSCSFNEEIFEYNHEDAAGISKVSSRGDDDDDDEIDWASVAIADGGGAGLGYSLASKSGNPYVIIASMVGIGAYASISEYQDQKDKFKETGSYISNGKVLIDFDNPVRPIEFERKFKLGLQENDLGQQHNYIIRTLRNSLDSVFTAMQQFGRVVDVCNTIYPNRNWSRYVTSNVIQNVLEEVKFQRTSITVINYNNLLYSMPIEELRDTTIAILSRLEPNTAEYQSIAVSYYSRILWNLSIPDPFIATECFVFDRVADTITYVEGRENVLTYDLSDERYLLMYPSSLEEGRLYIYDLTDNDNRQSSMNTSLTITDNMYSSAKGKSKVTFPIGEFQIVSTGYDGIYYIDTTINY